MEVCSTYIPPPVVAELYLKTALVRELEGFYSEKKYSSVRVIIDVDPQ